MGLHRNITGDDLHILQVWEYADQTAREAATGFVAADVGKVAKQEDNDTWWLLANHSPVTWKQVTDLVFGTEFNIAASLDLSFTTSNAWIEKLKLNLTDLPAGDYVLLWSCDLISGASGTPSLRVQADDVLILFEQENFKLPEDLKWYPFSGHAAATGWAGGTHFIDIAYHSNNPNQVGIQNARLAVWRAV